MSIQQARELIEEGRLVRVLPDWTTLQAEADRADALMRAAASVSAFSTSRERHAVDSDA